MGMCFKQNDVEDEELLPDDNPFMVWQSQRASHVKEQES